MVVPDEADRTESQRGRLPGEGRWSSEKIGGHPCQVYEPRSGTPGDFLLLYLHGVHQTPLSEQPAFVAELDRYGLPAVAPDGGRCWWVDRPCPEFAGPRTPLRHVVEEVVPWIGQRFHLAPPSLGLLGTSMGGQGVLRLSYQFPDMFPVCAAISPAIDFHRKVDEGDEVLMQMYEDSEQARQDTVVLHIHPLNWPRHQFFCCDPTDLRWHDGADRLRMKLQSLGIPHECDLETRGGGHGIAYYSQMAPRCFEFLVQRLQQERRRIA